MVDSDRLLAAFQTSRCDLIAECEASGQWIGQLSGSPLATAAAVSALALVGRHAPAGESAHLGDDLCRGETSQLIVKSLRWLMAVQQDDGGWGDCVGGPSNIVATMLVRSAFSLTCVPGNDDLMLERADEYIQQHGGLAAARRYCAGNKAYAAAVQTNLALAGLAPWSEVPQLPFELAGDSASVWNRAGQPIASGDFVPHDLAVVIAVGQARFKHRKPLNPLLRAARHSALTSSLARLQAIQPSSGGFLQAVPLTSFVIMSLASLDLGEHVVVRRGVEFLLSAVHGDGSWTLGADLAVRNTAAAAVALTTAEERLETATSDWLLAQQRDASGAAQGESHSAGWGSTDAQDLPNNCADTATVLLALAAILQSNESSGAVELANQRSSVDAAERGVQWLLARQNEDGGWPLVYCGDGKLALCRSATEITAEVMRALHIWQSRLVVAGRSTMATNKFGQVADVRHELGTRIAAALEEANRFLQAAQQPDGRWNALWLGNPWRPDQQSPTIGTARVLMAFRDLGRLDTTIARRGLDWLTAAQNEDSGWGVRPIASPAPAQRVKVNSVKTPNTVPQSVFVSSVEETAAAVECLAACGRAVAHQAALDRGIAWLTDAVEANRHLESSPIGLNFAKLWYRERMTSLTSAAAALGQAVRRSSPQSPEAEKLHSGNV